MTANEVSAKTTGAAQSGGTNAAARAIMPPHVVLHEFLDATTAAGLLDFALANEAAFTPTRTGHGGHSRIDPAIRVSLGTRNLGPFRPILREKVLALVPELVDRLRTTPVDAPELELQLVAHNDGAFFRHHIDTMTAEQKTVRVLSGVYYLHNSPKAFLGGALRLFAIGDAARATFVDIEPVHNTLLVFPSWAPHEVRPIICPSKRFADSRFAVNCWVHRPRP